METVSALRVKSLYKVYGSRADKAAEILRNSAGRDDKLAGLPVTAAVVDANFEVRRGEIFVVMGLSGSGKSTLIRMLNGLLSPTHGTVEIDGVDITKLKPAALRKLRREKISMVFQHFALQPHRSVLDNAGYALEIAGLPRAERREKALQALRMVGLDGSADKLPQELSGGMRQRVGLARALAAGTDIMLMDEAFSALDPLIRREVQDQLLGLQAELGKTIVFITHDLNEAMRLGDRIAVMRAGRIVQIGTAEEILTDPSNDYVAQFVADVDRTRILTASAVMERPLGVVDVNSGPRVAARVLRETQTSAVYVTGRDKRYLGTVTADAATQAVRDARKNLQEIVSTEYAHTVEDTTPVADIFAASAQSPAPVAVVDSAGRLVGVIPRVTLLSALGNLSTDTAGATATPGPADEVGTSPTTDPTRAVGAAGTAAPTGSGDPTAEVPAQVVAEPSARLTGEPA
ncbi:glycine betaine/L-proline ABC transporter ATP-binding protein [Verrucosispora sp. WMMD1129]|uniref:quaternary amine ABC transporter ATP-binding protein n=1 Tax=Verrucosispora sp. WMMD1129 TaxID=3016093 RepID=UPI00249BDFF7|nr:glycine betaine/L-proline ABC transporter ATP-binding protein [Verrucosispora sp. WMMD1129]WFE47228.1 glycine betaine/L-proline ABC transporter ATP-binding protein [Verrucosispora sp. WMMD1129]